MKNLSRAFLLSVMLFAISSPVSAVTAVGTETVLGKFFGVNLHMDGCCKGNYEDVNKVIERIKYIGARHLRGWATHDGVIGKWVAINKATGAKFNASIPQGSPKFQRVALARIDTWIKRYPGLIDAVEGSNEPDTEYPKSEGASLSDAVAMQSEVYRVGKSNRIPVVQLSVGGGWYPPLWEGNYKKFGKPPADIGNAHVYMNAGEPPSLSLKRVVDLAKYSVNNKPVDVTEFGVYQDKQSDETASVFMHLAPFSSYLLGHAGLSVYALHDDMSNVVGFYKASGTSRPVADYWHHTTTLLSDPKGKKLPSKNIAISFTNKKSKGTGVLGIKNVIMYKSDGSVWIATYDEEREGAADGSQTIIFDKKYPSVNIYDARTGQIVNKHTNIDRLDISLPANRLFLVNLSL